MKIKDEILVKMYQVLGKLFFAVAQADKEVRHEEIEAIKKMVREVWLDADATFDEFGTDTAYQIEIVVDYCFKNNLKVNNALDDLKNFKTIHQSIFTADLNELIMKTAYRIASSFAERNKSELVFLSQIQTILEEKPSNVNLASNDLGTASKH